LRGATLGLRDIINLAVTKSALSTLIVIITMVIGFFASLPVEIEIAAVIATAILNVILVSKEYKQPTVNFDSMLELLVKSLWENEKTHLYRSNIMLLDGHWYSRKPKKLRIKYRYNMVGCVDRDFCLEQSQGCAGRAFTTKNPYWVDVSIPEAHEKYYVDSGKVWCNMKSVLSVPIILEGKTLGTLNIDSTLDLNASGFNQEKIYTVTQAYADLVALLI
jgi:hypothetical protein